MNNEQCNLKMGDKVEVLRDDATWKERIFVKHGEYGGIIFVCGGFEGDFLTGKKFDVIFIEKGSWRIKKEPKYRPFRWEERNQLRDKWIRYKPHIHNKCGDYNEYRIVGFLVNSKKGKVAICGKEANFTFEELFKICEFLDGSKIGVEE